MGLLVASDALEFCRITETGLLGLMAIVFLSDIFHRGISVEMREKFNYPRWMAPVVGLVQISVVILNCQDLIHGDKAAGSLAQKLVACLMGGCAYTHIIIAKRPKDVAGAVAFFLFSCAIPALEGDGNFFTGLAPVLVVHIALAALGWTLAQSIEATQPKKVPGQQQRPLEESQRRKKQQ